MSYQPIENYGIIGNMRTVALVGMNGSIDWYCYPHFDSPSIFGAILDDDKGGRFQISPDSVKDAAQTVLLAFDEYPGHPLPASGRNRRTGRLHAGRGCLRFALVSSSVSTDSLRERVMSVFQSRCRPAFNYGRQTPRDPDRHQRRDTSSRADLILGSFDCGCRSRNDGMGRSHR